MSLSYVNISRQNDGNIYTRDHKRHLSAANIVNMFDIMSLSYENISMRYSERRSRERSQLILFAAIIFDIFEPQSCTKNRLEN